jgi:methionyl-tRNA formyltransferase
MPDVRFAFAGDRDISVWVLQYLLEQGAQPEALLVTEDGKATHADDLISVCAPFMSADRILHGKSFREPAGMELLRSLDLDYVIGIHFPYLVPENVLALPRIGVLNLHPAYLPYNRGWHTPTWALMENTPIGATLHFMAAGVDTGDIVHQKKLEVLPSDTANTLYQRLKRLEFEVFKEAWPMLVTGEYQRCEQNPETGTTHKRKELFTDSIQKIELDETYKAGELLQRLRALTTNQVKEAAYFEANGKRYRVQVTIQEDPPGTLV